MNANANARAMVPLGMYLREYYRSPLNLGLLIVIPVLLILAFGSSVDRLAALFEQSLAPEVGRALGAVWAASFLTGIMGFYMMFGAREADRRLVRCGYSTTAAVVLRLAAVAILGIIGTATSFLILVAGAPLQNYVITFAAIYVSALIYGAIGILIGSVISGELEGSFALLFFFIEDAFIGSPLFGSESIAFTVLPTHFPSLIVTSIASDQTHAPIHWIYSVLYLATVGALAGIAFYRTARMR